MVLQSRPFVPHSRAFGSEQLRRLQVLGVALILLTEASLALNLKKGFSCSSGTELLLL